MTALCSLYVSAFWMNDQKQFKELQSFPALDELRTCKAILVSQKQMPEKRHALLRGKHLQCKLVPSSRRQNFNDDSKQVKCIRH